ncbi:MAG: biotin carboxylase N-terminal domain-containing protein [Vampirovibrionales bacterium]|nr:biotin carboxylase N-terminal domain-containing protein [Vampirovibrionales bacterium]
MFLSQSGNPGHQIKQEFSGPQFQQPQPPQQRSIQSVLIANRGEIAVRIARTCQQLGIKAIAVYANPDKDAMHVREADEAWPLAGETLAETYLNAEQLIKIALRAGAQAIHPGYGFLSERAGFARAVQAAGIIWVGPSPESMALMADKSSAKTCMQEAGVPTLPDMLLRAAELTDDEGALHLPETLQAQAARFVGFPLLVKATAGGGGKGMRLVTSAETLHAQVMQAMSEARNAFGLGDVILEKYLPSARHIEVQLIGDAHGNVLHLHERECSLQRRHQKILEESPSTALRPGQREALFRAAVAAGKAVQYLGAGTVEFLFDDATGAFYFLEMNTRLQVEHPVTEWRTALDLVALQLIAASGEPLPLAQTDVIVQGHAIECRIYAEAFSELAQGFLPSTGTLAVFQAPNAPFMRLDSGVEAGDAVSINYDPQLAKLSVFAPTRKLALARMHWALSRLAILGVETNTAFLRQLILTPEVQANAVHTQWLTPQKMAELSPPNHVAQASEADYAQAISLAAAASVMGVSANAGPAMQQGSVTVNTDPYSPWQTI